MSDVLERLAVLLREEGGLMATLVHPVAGPDRPAGLAVASPARPGAFAASAFATSPTSARYRSAQPRF